tara:strand:+ start:54 stop:236 length:183 start_codon:yes stop_codon:yes gene_type:complete
MPKSMRVPVLVFEKHEEVEIMMSALHTYKETQKKYDEVRIAELLNEIYKINSIFEKTNNN